MNYDGQEWQPKIKSHSERRGVHTSAPIQSTITDKTNERGHDYKGDKM